MPMPHRTQLGSDMLAALSVATSIAAWQEQLEWGARMIATAIAIAAGSVALWQRTHRRR